MQLTKLNRSKALNFLKTGQLEGKGQRSLDSADSKFSDRLLSRQMDDFVALDMGRVRGDEDDRFGHISYRPKDGQDPVKVRVFGDTKDGGFLETVQEDGGVKATYAEFSRDSVRTVTVWEKGDTAHITAQHHDRQNPDNGYLIVG